LQYVGRSRYLFPLRAQSARLARQFLSLQQAVKDERWAVDVYLRQFQAGTVAFTTVVTAEIALLAGR
jgi:outer membrane protein TolC